MKIKIGNKYKPKSASVTTMAFYNKIKKTGLPVVCPCKINHNEILEATDCLATNYYLFKIVRNNKVTIFFNDDVNEIS